MIVQCQNCGSKFQVKDEDISSAGTDVRCSKCQTVFKVYDKESSNIKVKLVKSESSLEALLGSTEASAPPSDSALEHELFGDLEEDFNQQEEPESSDVEELVLEEDVAEEALLAEEIQEEATTTDPSTANRVEAVSEQPEPIAPPAPATFQPVAGKGTVSLGLPMDTATDEERQTHHATNLFHYVILPLLFLATIVITLYFRGVDVWKFGELKLFLSQGFATKSTGVVLVNFHGFHLDRVRGEPLFVIEGRLFNKDTRVQELPRLRATMSYEAGEQETFEFPCCLQLPLKRLRTTESMSEINMLYREKLDPTRLDPDNAASFLMILPLEEAPREYTVEIVR